MNECPYISFLVLPWYILGRCVVVFWYMVYCRSVVPLAYSYTKSREVMLPFVGVGIYRRLVSNGHVDPSRELRRGFVRNSLYPQALLRET